MVIEHIVIAALGIAVILLIFGVRNLLKQNEQLEDDLIKYILDMRTLSTNTLESMREIDIRGAFESDDEVGAIFNDLKSMVEQLNQKIGEYNVRAESKEN